MGLYGTFQTLSVAVACFGGGSQGHFHIVKKRLALNKGIKIIKVKMVITIKKRHCLLPCPLNWGQREAMICAGYKSRKIRQKILKMWKSFSFFFHIFKNIWWPFSSYRNTICYKGGGTFTHLQHPKQCRPPVSRIPMQPLCILHQIKHKWPSVFTSTQSSPLPHRTAARPHHPPLLSFHFTQSKNILV